jgi:hypothetical protein
MATTATAYVPGDRRFLVTVYRTWDDPARGRCMTRTVMDGWGGSATSFELVLRENLRRLAPDERVDFGPVGESWTTPNGPRV